MKRDYLGGLDFSGLDLSKRFAQTAQQTIGYCPPDELEQAVDNLSVEEKTGKEKKEKEKEKTGEKPTLKILSWNVNKNNQSRQWAEEFVSMVSAHRPDVMCLQEMRFPIDHAPSLSLSAHINSSNLDLQAGDIQFDGMAWSFAPNFIDTVAQTYSGVLTVSKATPVHSAAFLTERTEPITQTPKVSLLTKHQMLDSSVIVVNTHLINFVSSSVFQTQIDQIEAAIRAHRGAVVLAGDFNTWSRDRLQRLKESAARLGLSSATFSSQDHSRIKRFLFSPPLDHIFYRGFQQNVSEATVLDFTTSSDHRPLVIELSC